MAYTYLGDGTDGAEDPTVDGVVAPGRIGTLMNWVGAVMSMALIAGLTVWGYQLAVRDVTGVPVVQALAGPMRIAPEDPGGMRAAHQGLAVNDVTAAEAAPPPAEQLILAPAPLDLNEDDLPQADLAEGPVMAEAVETETSEDAAVAEALALADALAEGVTPLAAPITPTPDIAVIPASVKGVARSPMPVPRPSTEFSAKVVPAAVTTEITTPEIEPDTMPAGTRLVQFGAYDSPEAARAEWDELAVRYGDFLDGKSRVIQKAVSGGKTFYRLRAAGFDDINDARRFCTTFLADRQPCIPVVTR